MDIDPRLRGDNLSPTTADTNADGPDSRGKRQTAASGGHAADSEHGRSPSRPTPYTSASTFSPQSPTTPSAGTNGHHADASGESPIDNAPDDPDAALGAPGDPKKPRACEACRGLKVRCDPDVSNPDGPCRRCAKAGRNCIVTQPTRKRQRKTDSRVAELEKKIDALTQSLQATRGGGAALATSTVGSTPGSSSGPASYGGGGTLGLTGALRRLVGDESGGYGASSHGNGGSIGREWGAKPSREAPQRSMAQQPFTLDIDKEVYPPPMVMAGQKRKFTESRENAAEDVRDSPAAQHPAIQSVGAEYSDVIDRGVLTMDRATELFARYTSRMVQHLPAVVFAEGTTAAEVRKSKPILFLAIMAASSSEFPNIQRPLVRELMQIFAEKVIITGEKSIELVQALQIAVIWYWPPEHFEELKFYQLVHIAAIMAIDIGLGRKKSGGRMRRHIPYTWRDHPFKKHPPPDPTSLEARRAWLTCYFLSSNTSMALHRPILLRWTPFMTECVDILESSPDASPTDRYLCHLVWTHRLAEEVGIQFSMDDPSVVINIADARTQYALKGFERDLEKYRSTIPAEMLQPALLLSFYVLSLYMHEIALHSEKNEEIKPPYTGDSIREALANDGPLTPAHINALSSCLTAIDGIFETFLAMEVVEIRCIPVFNFVRVAYAVVVLIKMYFAASSPKSELGKVINKDNMKVEQHLEALLEKFRATAADDKSRPAAKFLVVLVMLRSWFQRQSQPGARGKWRREGGKTFCGGFMESVSNLEPRPIDKDTELSTQPQQQQQRSQQQAQVDYATSANTPLQLLSEVATTTHDNPAVNSSSPGPGGRPGGHLGNLTPWATLQQAQQPFMYDQPSVDGATPAGGGGGGGGGGGTGASGTADDGAASAGDGAPLPPQRPVVVPGPVMPWLNSPFADELDYGGLGDGFQEALDFTMAGLTDGVAGGDVDMRFADQPWIEEMIGQVPGGNIWPF